MRCILIVLLLSNLACIKEDNQPLPKKESANNQAINNSSKTIDELINSSAHRDRGADLLNQRQYSHLSTLDSLPTQYASTVDVYSNDESYAYIIDQALVHPSTSSCGLSGTLESRINDCDQVFDASSIGNSAESKWDLVLRVLNIELWRDRQSGLVFSSIVDKQNWCRAAGNDQDIQNSSNVTLTDCAPLVSSMNICKDTGDNLGLKMRLPTRNDFLRAEISGIRLLWPNWSTSNYSFWSSTLKSDQRNYAWTYSAKYGQTNFVKVNSTAIYITCVAHF